MHHDEIEIETSDGSCIAHFMAPTSNHKGPSVIFYMDAGGIRPAVIEMAKRLATSGYNVLLPDLFYRYGSYGPFVPEEVFAGDVQAILGPLISTTGNAKSAEDTSAFLAALDEQSNGSGNKVGTVGFCMGGGMAIAAAGICPDRIAAVASFHGGNLATDAPDSPHLYAPMLDAELFIAAATDDESYPNDMAERFERALKAAGISFSAETFSAAHGWMKPDFPVYNKDAAERGWQAMLDLFERTLK
ncbi:MAG: dienelactone hydrolase family protein [Pseudomonadota bacterium]